MRNLYHNKLYHNDLRNIAAAPVTLRCRLTSLMCLKFHQQHNYGVMLILLLKNKVKWEYFSRRSFSQGALLLRKLLPKSNERKLYEKSFNSVLVCLCVRVYLFVELFNLCTLQKSLDSWTDWPVNIWLRCTRVCPLGVDWFDRAIIRFRQGIRNLFICCKVAIQSFINPNLGMKAIYFYLKIFYDFRGILPIKRTPILNLAQIANKRQLFYI